MSAFHDIILAGASGQQGYQISRSVRLRSSASAYFSRTFGTPTNNLKWTWSGWVKRGSLSTASSYILFGSGDATPNNFFGLRISGFTSDTIYIFQAASGTYNLQCETSALFRDPSAWYHIVMVYDSANATSTDRVQIYVNGVRQSISYTTGPFAQNTASQANSARQNNLGAAYYSSSNSHFDGYMTEVNFIDGQAITPSSFGENDLITGVWKPKKYAGTYGTNGFYLNFSDNSSNTSTTIGKDWSGNSNNWTPNNISVTAGTTYDSMLDTPTPYADGGNGRGNYAVNNPLNVSGGTYADGNLTWTSPATDQKSALSTIPVTTTGNWYCEITIGSKTGSYWSVGVLDIGTAWSLRAQYRSDGATNVNGTGGSTWASYTTNDVIGISYNSSTGVATFYKNNTSQGSLTVSSPTTTQYFGCSSDSSGGTSTYYVNHGQRPFSYTPPTGFKALNTQNLPDSTIKKGNAYFDVLTWTGDGTSSRAITGLNFQPDLVWDKMRSGAYQHAIVDAVRGGNQVLHSNSTSAEDTNWQYGYVSSFNSNGFTIQAGSTSAENWNLNGSTFAAWNWKESVTAGFDIVTYTGNGSTQNVSHSLGVAPSMIIVKNRTNTGGINWPVYHRSLAANQNVWLNLTNAVQTDANMWNNTAPTSSVFSVGATTSSNGSGNGLVAYLFAEVAGFSRFGSYTGNGSSDGPFIYLGMRARWLLIKRTDSAGHNWDLIDTARDTYNTSYQILKPNASEAQVDGTLYNWRIDITANGFKCRDTNAEINASGGTYIYAAFAENPFKNSLAR